MLGQRSGRIILGNPEAGNVTVIRLLQQPKGGAGYCDSLDILLQWNSAPFTAGDAIPLSIQIKGAGLVIRAFLSRFEIPRPRPSSKEYIGEDQELYHSLSEGICRTTSHDSIVYNLTKDPMLTEAWKTLGRPCQSVYIPVYPLAGPAKGTAFMDGATATKEHFAGTPSMFDYRADFAPHAVFSASNNAIDYLRADELAKRTKLIHEQEAAFMADRDAVTKKAASLKGEERTKFLHDYNEAAYQKVLGVIQAENARLMPNKVKILSKVVRADHEDDVQFVLYGTKGHEVLGANMSATRAGMSANQLNSTRQWKNFAPATKMEYKDVNGDGLMDVVFTFKSKELAKGAVPGAVMDLWLYTQINGHRVTGFDAVPVETDKVKKGESRNGKGLL